MHTVLRVPILVDYTGAGRYKSTSPGRYLSVYTCVYIFADMHIYIYIMYYAHVCMQRSDIHGPLTPCFCCCGLESGPPYLQVRRPRPHGAAPRSRSAARAARSTARSRCPPGSTLKAEGSNMVPGWNLGSEPLHLHVYVYVHIDRILFRHKTTTS